MDRGTAGGVLDHGTPSALSLNGMILDNVIHTNAISASSIVLLDPLAAAIMLLEICTLASVEAHTSE